MRRSTLRVRLLTIMLCLTVLTVTGVGASGYFHMRNTATELAGKILDQTSERIDHRLDDLVHTAVRRTDLNKHLIDSGLVRPRNFTGLAAYWYEVIGAYPSISNMYITLEEDGATLNVAREPQSREVFVQELRPGRVPGTFDLFTYRPREHRLRHFAFAARAVAMAAAPLAPAPLLAATAGFATDRRPDPEGRRDLDQRQWGWYKETKASGRPSWTVTDPFFDERKALKVPGVSYVTPLREGGELVGVLGVDFDAYSLCAFLRGLEVSANGFAFVLERRRDGRLELVAHPQPAVLVGGAQSQVDPIVGAFMAEVPGDIDPVRLRERVPVRFRHGGQTYLGRFRGLEEDQRPAPPWLICIVLPEEDVLADARRHAWISLGLAAGVLLLAAGLSLVTAGQVARPLEAVARETEAIGRFEIDARPVPRSVILEVDRLACATEDMKTSLRSFRKYVPADLVRRVFESGREAELGGEHRRLTVCFSDIADFTTISESMGPEALVAHLGEYLEAMSAQVLAAGGTVDKYIGDAIMAFWGAPAPHPEHALAACTAAVRNQQRLVKLREQWRAEGRAPFRARVGINTGEVIVGNIGSAARLNYTVIGDAVNLASRLEGLNKFYGTEVLISESTYEEAKAGVVARPVDWVSVKGKKLGVLVCELLGLRGEVGRDVEEFAELFTRGLVAYRRQGWDEAARLFEEVRRQRPDDGPARELLRRCEAYRATPPGDDWDGVHHMESK